MLAVLLSGSPPTRTTRVHTRRNPLREKATVAKLVRWGGRLVHKGFDYFSVVTQANKAARQGDTRQHDE
jgi:hypothetical protein